jgi:ribosomal protein L6P/L9E
MALNVYFYEKIKFTGKGFRIRYKRKKKLIKFYFGRSHLTWVYFRNIKVKRPHKYKFLIYKSSLKQINILSKKIKQIKPINIYTKRGLRTKRQKIYKRKGKKNTTI